MKYAKTLGVLAAAAAAFMALASSAAATTLTSPAGTTYLGTIHAASEGHISLHTGVAKTECASTLHGDVAVNGLKHGGTVTTPATVSLTAWNFTNCTNSWHVTTVTPGDLTFVSNANGTADVFSNGATWETTRFGITCRYATNTTTVGTLTPSVGGTEATMHVGASMPFHSGSGLCGSGASPLTGGYNFNTPAALLVD